MNDHHLCPTTARSPERDRGSILVISMVIIIVFSTVAVAIASYSSAALRASTVTKSRMQALAAAEGGMRIALEDIRLPRAVGDGKTTNGSTTVTSATAGFRADDVGKGIEGSGIPAGSTIVSVTNATTVSISDAATITASNVYIAYGNAICGASTTTILSTTVNGSPVSVKCIRQPSVPGEFGPPALVVTGPDGLELKEDTTHIYGDVFFAQPSTISLSKKLIVESGNIWYPASSCPAAKPSISKLMIERPDAFTYQCVATSAADNYSDLFANPVLSAVPALAPVSKKVGSCEVFSPGRYTSSNKPNLVNRKEAYLKSGVYYFDNVGEIKIKDTIITGGQPGESEVAEADESLWNPNCKNAAKNSSVNDTGTGVTIVLGGNSRLLLDDRGGLELYAPNNGYSIVAYAADTNGYTASTGGTTSAPLISQEAIGSSLRVHGNVWAPSGYVFVGEPTPAAYTDAGIVAMGGQFLGGAVVKWIQIDKKPPTGGYNLQADVAAKQYRVLVVATAGTSVVRAVADVRPSGEELALRSWQTSGSSTIALPSTPPLVTKPALATGSDTGTLADNITNKSTPTFTGSAAPGATVKLFANGSLVGSGTASASGTYTITPTSALAAGEHALVATATDSGGDTNESLETGITIDLTAPTIAATDVVVAPIANTAVGGYIKQGGQYYVYANATDTSSIATLTANVSSLTTGSTAVALTAGEYTIAGVLYGFRAGPLTANSTLAEGAKTITATATDHAANVTISPNATITVDNVGPTGAITSPTAGSTLAVSQNVSSNSTDATSGVASVDLQYSVSGAGSWTTLSTLTTAPYQYTWNTSALTGASYDLRAVATDNAGNTSTSATVTAGNRPPDKPSTPVIASASDTGITPDLKTSDDTPTLTGTAQAGSAVKIYDGATQRGSGTADASGNWSITASTLSEGTRNLTATATNAGGLVSTPSDVATVVIDRTDPTFSSADITVAWVNNTTTPLFLKQGGQYYVYAKPVDTGSGIWTVVANVNNLTTGSNAVTMTAGSWTIGGVTYTWRSPLLTANSTLNAGGKSFSVTATDEAGNTKGSGNKNVEIDNTVPSGSLTAPDIGAVVPASATVSSNSADGVSVGWADFQWSASGLNAWATIDTVDTSSPYSVTWDTNGLTQGGTYDLRVVTTDSAGNTFTSATVTVTIDKVAPVPPSTPVLAPASDTGKVGDNRTRSTTPTLMGTAEAGTTVKLYDGATLVGTSIATGGSWSIVTSILTNGSHTITATSTDAAGNVSPASSGLTITVDATAPTIVNGDLFNAAAGTLGTAGTGDYAVVVFSEQLLASSLCSTWTDDTIVQTLTDVTLTIQNNGGADRIALASATCTWNLGTFDLRKDYVNSQVQFNNSTVTWDPATFTLTLTLGTWDGAGTIKTGVAADKVEITPVASIQTDIAGNYLGTAKFSDSTNSRF